MMQQYHVVPSTRVKIHSLDDLARPDYIRWKGQQDYQEQLEKIHKNYPPEEANKHIDFLRSLDSAYPFGDNTSIGRLDIPSEYQRIYNILIHIKICVDSPQAMPLIAQASSSVPGLSERIQNKVKHYGELLLKDVEVGKSLKFKRDFWGDQIYKDLVETYQHHIERNQKRVDGDGANAVCKTHLVQLEMQRSGPVSYWWCPICHDDDPVFLHVKTLQGVFGNAAPKEDGLSGSVLKINLSSRMAQKPVVIPYELDEIHISPQTDSYDLETFLMLYSSSDVPRKALNQIKCFLSPRSGLSSNSLNMIRDHFGFKPLPAQPPWKLKAK